MWAVKPFCDFSYKWETRNAEIRIRYSQARHCFCLLLVQAAVLCISSGLPKWWSLKVHMDATNKHEWHFDGNFDIESQTKPKLWSWSTMPWAISQRFHQKLSMIAILYNYSWCQQMVFFMDVWGLNTAATWIKVVGAISTHSYKLKQLTREGLYWTKLCLKFR